MFKSRDVLIIAAVVLFVFALAIWGFSVCAGSDCKPWAQRAIGAGNLFARGGAAYAFGRDPWQLALAQFIAPYIVPFAALLAALKFIIANLRRDVHVLLARYQKHHTIVVGLGKMGIEIVQILRNRGESVVAIDDVADSLHAKACEQQGIPVLKGNAWDSRLFRLAGISRARAVVICTGNDVENLDAALRIKEIAGSNERFLRERLLVLAEVRNNRLFTGLMEHDKEPLGSVKADLRPFNTCENAARMLVQSIRLPPPELAGRTFMIVGFGEMGQELAVHITRAALDPSGGRLNILVCDRRADELGREFLTGMPRIETFAEFTFLSAELNYSAHESWVKIEEWLCANMPIAVAICLNNDSASVEVALEMRRRLDSAGHAAVPLFVRLPRRRALGAFAGSVERLGGLENRFRSFGDLEDLLASDDLGLDALACAYHEAHLMNMPENRRRTPAARPWHELAETFKASSRRFADHLHIKLSQSGLRIEPVPSAAVVELSAEETESLARLEHRRWTIERRLQGWEFGEPRSDAKRRHPYLIDWDQLPVAVQEYNRRQMAAVPAILARVGFEIRRERILWASGSSPLAALELTADRFPEQTLILADLCNEEECKRAFNLLRSKNSTLWLTSNADLDEVIRDPELEDSKRLLIAKAAGWVRRDRLKSASQIVASAQPSESEMIAAQ